MANHQKPAVVDKPQTDRRPGQRAAEGAWPTSITQIQPNEIMVRGYSLDELMGRLGFGEAVYLLLRGELPTPSIGKMFGAVLVSSIDHGVTPPSTLAARNVATSGAPLRDSVAAGLLGFGPYLGGDVESCMRFLEEGLALRRDGASPDEAATKILRSYEASQHPPGFGHRFHTRDPRAARLFQMAHELELDGAHCSMLRAVEHALEAQRTSDPPPPVNVDGAIAAVCGDLGFEPELGNGLYIISRIPGLIAHAREEHTRHKPLRLIDPTSHYYDGPPRRRLPETRK